MKYILYILVFLVSISLQAQDQLLEMSKNGTEKLQTFKENKRIKVKTIEGEKYIGKFQIIDVNTIEIEGNPILLSSISNIKSRSVVAGIAGTVLIISGAYFIVISPLAALVAGSTSGFSFMIGGTVITSAGIFFNEFAKNYRSNKWTYKIIEK